METFTVSDLKSLYDELKDVNPEDYWDKENNCFYVAFAGPISDSAYEQTSKIVHLFDKERFRLFPTHTGYVFTSKLKSEYLYSFETSDKYYICVILNKENRERFYGDKGVFENSNIVEAANKFINELKRVCTNDYQTRNPESELDR